MNFATDGTRVYYTASALGVDVFQISVKGGEAVKIPSLSGMIVHDISPDHSELLLTYGVQGPMSPLWAAPVLGGAPRRLGDLAALGGATWSPTGDRVVYATARDVYIAHSDGTEARKVATVPGQPILPRMSPDGRTIRFTLTTDHDTVWEMSSEGRQLHAVFRRLWRSLARRWKLDSRWHLLFLSRRLQ